MIETDFPQAVREFAGTIVAQTREAYDRSTDAFDAAVDNLERSFVAANQGAAAFNRMIIGIAQRNLKPGFDLAKRLARAKILPEFVELYEAYWRNQFDALTTQAEEVRALSTKVTADAAASMKAQVARGVDTLAK